jgi:aspartyl/asparaginyl beta-hydroxylase (cupin superfamily)
VQEPFENLSLEEQIGAMNVLGASIKERLELTQESMAEVRVLMDKTEITADDKTEIERLFDLVDKVASENEVFMKQLNQWIDEVNARLAKIRNEGEEWKQ